MDWSSLIISKVETLFLMEKKKNNCHYSPSNTGLLDPATSDGRVIFFLPWEGMTIAGTTDAPMPVTFNPSPSNMDIEFILQEVRRYLSDDVTGL